MGSVRWLGLAWCGAMALGCGGAARGQEQPRAAAAPGEALRAAAAPGLQAIHGYEIEANARFLSDDLLEGRGTGTRGHELAAAYVATKFRELGLEPAGEQGSYFQRVPLRVMKRVDAECGLALSSSGAPDESLKGDEDAVFLAFAHSESARVRGELVYAGFGLDVPEFGYHDTAGVDWKGKIAVIYWGAPPTNGAFFPTAERAVYSDTVGKAAKLKALGVEGLLVVTSPELLKVFPWKATVAHFRRERMDWLNGDQPGSSSSLPTALLSPEAFERLATRAKIEGGAARLWEQARQGKAAPKPLGITAELKIRSTFGQASSPNVAGVLRGSDPEVARETVVYSAHLDHFGLGAASGTDKIFNGAIDNACGSSTMLGVARGFASLPQRPRRSILFLATTGEEMGLIGSSYFAARPTLPIETVVADVNLDAQNPMHEMFAVAPLGAEHSALLEHVKIAADLMAIKIAPDPDPEASFFIRSDQFSFVKRGVVSVFPVPGPADAAGHTEANQKALEQWFAEHYHKPSDEWRPHYKGDYLAKEARFNFLLGLSIAQARERPRWNRGDFFATHKW